MLGWFLGGGKGGKVQVGTVTVTFGPGSRTYWHSQDDGQVLIAADGHGAVENRDGDRHLLHPDDAVVARPHPCFPRARGHFPALRPFPRAPRHFPRPQPHE